MGQLWLSRNRCDQPCYHFSCENPDRSGYESSLSTPDTITIDDVCDHANAGDDLAKQALVRVENQLGKAIAITVNLFNRQRS